MQRPTYLPQLICCCRRCASIASASSASRKSQSTQIRWNYPGSVSRKRSPKVLPAHYPDIAEAYAAGTIPDLQQHYIETGFFEGRLGAPPAVDEALLYLPLQGRRPGGDPGRIASATEHYLRQGAAEGRIPNPQIKREVDFWVSILRDDIRAP